VQGFLRPSIDLIVFTLTLSLTSCSLHKATADRSCRDCLELDHVFIFVSKDAPERESLIRLGFRAPDRVARHTGQGTASVGFAFENAYLELLWVEDEKEFQATCSADGEEFCARAQWRETGASPLGIGLRNRCGDSHPPRLKYREHRAEWMKPDSCIYIIEDAGIHEPEYFVVPPYMALPAWVENVDTTHPIGARRLSRAEITVCSKGHGVSDFGIGSGFNFVSADSRKPLSRAARLVGRSTEVGLHHGQAPLLVLTLDDDRQGKSADLRPELPLVIKY